MERENNRYVMDWICCKPKAQLNDTDVWRFNYYQLFLQVHRLSNICTADGKYMFDTILEGTQSIRNSVSRDEEILQENPDAISWRTWRKMLKELCVEGSCWSIRLDKQNELGHWTRSIQQSRRLWPFYQLQSNRTLYRSHQELWHSNNEYQFDSYISNNNEVYNFVPKERNILIEFMPEDAVPVVVVHTGFGWRVYKSSGRVPPSASPLSVLEF